MNNKDQQTLIKGIIVLAVICLGVGIAARIRQNSQVSLSDYADANPEIAYATVAPTDSPPPSKDALTESDSDELQDFGETVAATISPAVPDSEVIQGADATTTFSLMGASLNEEMISLRTVYKDDFYFEPLSDCFVDAITGISYPAFEDEVETEPAITPAELRYLHVLYVDFDGNTAEGELICNEAIAQDLAEIFYELYQNDYRIERVRLIDAYNGDDEASMEDNNTSCFNYRSIPSSTRLSQHAYGLAIDINPFYNPYITYQDDGSSKITPVGSEKYADRDSDFAYKIDSDDLCYRLFTEHGFTWGGNWNTSKDYQHFQKKLK